MVMFVEEMSVSNSDLRSFRLRPAPGLLPPGVNAAQLHSLPQLTPVQMAAYRTEAERVISAESAQRGAGALANGGGCAGRCTSTPGQIAVALTSLAGDWVNGVGAIAEQHARSVHVLPDGTSIFVQCVDGGKINDSACCK